MMVVWGLLLRAGKFVLGSPVAQVALLVLAAYAFGQWQGRDAAKDRCEARVAREVATERERQRAVGAAAIARLKAALDKAEADETAAQQELLRFEAEVAARPKAEGCALSDADAKEINR